MDIFFKVEDSNCRIEQISKQGNLNGAIEFILWAARTDKIGQREGGDRSL